jgi:restriction system protein
MPTASSLTVFGCPSQIAGADSKRHTTTPLQSSRLDKDLSAESRAASIAAASGGANHRPWQAGACLGAADRNRFLRQFPEFIEFLTTSQETEPGDKPQQVQAAPASERTPEELIETGYRQVQSALASDLLERVKAASPRFFEHLVVQLLVAMGYGGSIEEAGKALGKPGDEGIDGIIKEDRLGLDVIYLQAKRWERTIGRPDIQQFAGALQGQRARKSVFITTSSFSADAKQYAERIDTRIILIDGTELARLMIAHGVGVTPVAVYELKRVDSDFFAED